MKHCFFLLLFFATLFSCKQGTPGYHDGYYIFKDSSHNPVLEESISINRSWATLRFRSVFNKSKLKKTKYLCFQDSGKIDLYMGKKQHPLSIPVNKDGNLVWDGRVFIKQPERVISNTPVSAFFLQEQQQ